MPLILQMEVRNRYMMNSKIPWLIGWILFSFFQITEDKIIREIADSRGNEFNNYQLAKTELLRVSTPDSFQLPVLITWPLHMDSSKKYPVLITIYGGPNAGTVYDGWKGIGQNEWWAKEGLIQVAIDHRG